MCQSCQHSQGLRGSWSRTAELSSLLDLNLVLWKEEAGVERGEERTENREQWREEREERGGERIEEHERKKEIG